MNDEKRNLNPVDDNDDFFENEEILLNDAVTTVGEEEEVVVSEEPVSSGSSTEEEIITEENKDEENKKNSFYLSVYDMVSVVMSAFIIIIINPFCGCLFICNITFIEKNNPWLITNHFGKFRV